jgi:hypothetical protein
LRLIDREFSVGAMLVGNRYRYRIFEIKLKNAGLDNQDSFHGSEVRLSERGLWTIRFIWS